MYSPSVLTFIVAFQIIFTEASPHSYGKSKDTTGSSIDVSVPSQGIAGDVSLSPEIIPRALVKDRGYEREAHNHPEQWTSGTSALSTPYPGGEEFHEQSHSRISQRDVNPRAQGHPVIIRIYNYQPFHDQRAYFTWTKFWSDVIKRTDGEPILMPFKTLTIMYELLQLEMKVQDDEDMDLAILKKISQVFLKFSFGYVYGLMYFAVYIGPMVIVGQLAIRPQNMVIG